MYILDIKICAQIYHLKYAYFTYENQGKILLS